MEVQYAFYLAVRDCLCLAGPTSGGALEAGLRVVAPPELDAEVAAVEFLLVRTGAPEVPAVLLHPRDPDERERWQRLHLVGRSISLSRDADSRRTSGAG